MLSKINLSWNNISILSRDISQSIEKYEIKNGRGHPGWVVRCLETGEVFASQNEAAAYFGIRASDLSKHLNGIAKHAGDLYFERLHLAEYSVD